MPARLFAELQRHGLGRFVVRLLAVVEGCENFFNILIAEALGGKRENVRDLHGRLRDGAGFVHAEDIDVRQRLDAVHILHEHTAA